MEYDETMEFIANLPEKVLLDIDTPEFRPWGKTPRYFDIHAVVTEKIDGTNALIHITEDGRLYPGSRNRWLSEGKKTDNYGFATFCAANREELLKLGPGWHYGEWWGRGIGRGYGFNDAAHSEYANQGRFLSLFNTRRWGAHNPTTPRCVTAVPILAEGRLAPALVNNAVARLQETGSVAAPGFMDVEGVVVYLPQFDSRMKIVLDKKGPSPIE